MGKGVPSLPAGVVENHQNLPVASTRNTVFDLPLAPVIHIVKNSGAEQIRIGRNTIVGAMRDKSIASC